jgi:hypothetical protein
MCFEVKMGRKKLSPEKKVLRITITLDRGLVSYLSSRKNKSGYISNLIREDKKKNPSLFDEEVKQ